MDRLAYYRRWKLGEDPHALAKEAGVTRERMRHMLAKMDADVPLVDQLDAMRDRIEADAKRIAELEAELASGSFYKETDIDALMNRATAAEARVKVLEDALTRIERLARLVAHDLVGRVETGKVGAVQNCADIARAALEGEK